MDWFNGSTQLYISYWLKNKVNDLKPLKIKKPEVLKHNLECLWFIYITDAFPVSDTILNYVYKYKHFINKTL